jgi:hypothetical protein
MKAERVIMATPLLQWYMNHGLKVSNVIEVIEFTPRQCFRTFVQEVSDARRNSERDPSKSVLFETAKLIRKSAFGGLIINKEKLVYYVKGKANCMREANKPNFVKCTELEGEI